VFVKRERKRESARLSQMPTTSPPFRVWIFHIVSVVVVDEEERNE
jgi:hypothetical protein